jgi:signal transduction histidine kinase
MAGLLRGRDRLEERSLLGLALGAFLVLAVLFATQLYVWVNWWPIRIGWGTAVLWSLPQMGVWVVGVRVVVSLVHRWPIQEPHRNRRLIAHTATSILLSFAGLAFLDLSDRALRWSVALGAPSSIVSGLKYTIIHLHMGIGVYWVTLAVTQATMYRTGLRSHQERLRALDGDLAQARLAALRSQLQPHFLFNTLNGILVSIRQNPDAAETMVHRLSDFLRLTLETTDVQEITVSEELAALETYLEIERVRFGPRLRTSQRLGQGAGSCLVPTLLLQPLVENAVRHAVSVRTSGGCIDIAASRQGDRLILTVRDDGPGLPATMIQGIGTANTRRRLETHYGTAASFALSTRCEGGVEARLELPAREGGLGEGGAL